MSSHIAKITLAIETDTGEAHVIIVDNPAPFGSNPAFMSQQFETALAEVSEKGHAVIAALYGNQIRVDS